MERPVRPHVVVYNEASIDGRVVGFDTDPSRYYRLGFRWRSDAILMGSTTALAFGPPESETDQQRILLRPERLGPDGILFQSAVVRAVVDVPGGAAQRALGFDRTPFIETGRRPAAGA